MIGIRDACRPRNCHREFFWPVIDHISKRKHALVEYDRRVVECRRVPGAGAVHCRVWCEPGAEAS